MFDLVLVSSHFGGSTASTAPSPNTQQMRQPAVNCEQIRRALAVFLRAWLVNGGSIMLETKLLLNYPNPFNPETWFPYQLARDEAVKITIYDIRGKLVRRLDLGHQAAGYYVSPDRAAYLGRV